MRGKAKHTHAFQFRHRITPACAGKRLCLTCVLAILWDHPRMCGEKGLSTFWSRNHSGSPPRMRGKGICFRLEKRPRGITPACAGKSKCRLVSCGHIWDHPRMCGEKLFAFLVFCPNIGSPPHVRGKEGKEYLQETESRITPACAGKRLYHSPSSIRARDHPRMCGEKPDRCERPEGEQWITPACAGKSD